MRPQHITAENFLPILWMKSRYYSFNEAAAYHCGKRSHYSKEFLL